MKIKTLGTVFVLAFLLNLLWENLHSYLYTHYQSGAITETILIRAALFDAAVIFVLAFGVILTPAFRGKFWLAIGLSFVIAMALERYALAVNRWAYAETMPIIPIFSTGLTPTIQLALTLWIIFKRRLK